MKRKKAVLIAITVLILLASAQIIIDYMSERDLNRKANQVIKETDYCIFIEIEDKTLYLLQSGKCVKKYTIASGMPTWPSPIGYWRIVDKGDWGEGFGGSWMGLNVPWGTYGIHGTIFSESIGSDASHGCIRMLSKDAKELYNLVQVGTPVTILNGCFGPFGTGFKTIEPGDRGADVLAIQVRLAALGYYNGKQTGIYEDDLKLAIHNFQKKKGLQVKNAITKKDYLAMGFKDFE